ncbi:MAG: biotin synthase BioB [Verrucomicrobiota bacterium]
MALLSLAELKAIYEKPLFELIEESRAVTRQHWKNNEIQLCTLLSIKTGGCSEDCGYCAQSSRHSTGLGRQKLMTVEEVMPYAEQAKAKGSTRFCMGAAWKGVRENTPQFEQVKETIGEVSKLGMEVCVTLGSLTEKAAEELKEAGVTAYNHNIDTSPDFYDKVVSTHSFQDRLNTIKHVQNAGMDVCCGGILGMGETAEDRLKMLQVLTSFDPAPESCPINCLTTIPGTPMEDQKPLETFELIRMIATTRIALPHTKVRLSAGRSSMSKETQAWCFFAGANSIFYGNKLLTTGNPENAADEALLEELNLVKQMPYTKMDQPEDKPQAENTACPTTGACSLEKSSTRTVPLHAAASK